MKSKLIRTLAGTALALTAITAIPAVPAEISAIEPFDHSQLPTVPEPEVFVDGDNEYSKYPEEDFIRYSRYTGEAKILEIPAEFNGLPVKVLEGYSLKGCPWLEEVILPDTMVRIGENVLVRSYEFKYIAFPKNLETLDAFAFTQCPFLEHVKMNRNLKYIGEYAFQLCNTIKAMNFPGSVEKIPNNIFQNMRDLTTVRFMEGTKEISFEAGLNAINLKDVVIPPSVTKIDHNAFGYNMVNSEYIRSGDVRIFGTPGSEAERYAKANDVPFVEFDYAYGDVNSDGIVDAGDATDVLNEYAVQSTGNKSNFTRAQYLKCEINENNIIDANDASTVLSYYAYSSSGGTDSPAEFFFFGK